MDVLAAILGVTNVATAIAAYRLNARNADERRAREEAEDERRDAEAALQREREQREAERREDAERRETQAARPVIVVEHAGASGDGGQLDRRLVKVRVSNKGPTTALRVEVGIRLAGNEIAAGPGGTPGVIPAFAPTDEPRVLIVQVDSPVWRSMLLHEVDHPPLWARWTDTRGTEYSDEVASP